MIKCFIFDSLTLMIYYKLTFMILVLDFIAATDGGGVIEFVLGNGALSLPKAAIGTAAVAGMTVPLHPIAIAGFIGLIINALAVLPIGSKS